MKRYNSFLFAAFIIAISIFHTFRIPIFPGCGFLGIGANAELKPQKKQDILIPPFAPDKYLLCIHAGDADSITYTTSHTRQILWKRHQTDSLIAIPCILLKGLGTLEANYSGTRTATINILGGPSLSTIAFFLTTWGILILFSFRYFSTNSISGNIFRSSLSLRFGFGILIPWNFFSFDAMEHMHYIKLIANNLAIPAPSACLECYQPPPYYLITALLYNISTHIGIHPPDFLRCFSLLLTSGALLLGLTAITHSVENQNSAKIASLLFAFWPASLLSAPIINNDQPIFILGMATFLMLLHWKRTRSTKHLFFSLLAAGAASLFKSNGILLLAPIGLALRLASHKGQSLSRREVALFLAAITLTLFGFFSFNALRSQESEKSDPLVGNIQHFRQVLPRQQDEADWTTFLPTPSSIVATFQRRPPANHTDAFTHNFWAVSWRSNIDGAFDTPMNILLFQSLLIIFILLAIAAIVAIFLHTPDAIFLSSCIGIFLLASMLFRLRYPFISSANIRYILVITLPFAILVGRSTERSPLWWKHSISAASWTFAILSSFTIISIIFA